MERGLHKLPGIALKAPSAEERIAALREACANTAWYDRGASSRLTGPLETATVCSWFTIFLLDGDSAWTKNQDGTKYQQWRMLKATVMKPVYYCSRCRQRWSKFDKALSHVEVKL
jgi:hypothetical protein